MKLSQCGLRDEIFSFVSEVTGQEFHWNTTKVQEAMVAGLIEPIVSLYVDITEADYLHVSQKNGIEEHHLAAITPERMKVPIIIAEFPPDENDPHPSHVVIDGNHRLVKRYRDGGRRIGAAVFDVETLKPYLVEDMPTTIGDAIKKIVGG